MPKIQANKNEFTMMKASKMYTINPSFRFPTFKLINLDTDETGLLLLLLIETLLELSVELLLKVLLSSVELIFYMLFLVENFSNFIFNSLLLLATKVLSIISLNDLK